MPLPNTIQEKFAGATFGGTTREVLARDPSRLVNMYTDFVFDAMDANGYVGGALPSVSAVVPTAGMTNLANDTAPALSRTAAGGAVTLIPRDTANKPTFSGKGWSINGSTKIGLQVKKIGKTDANVGRPADEGWIDHVLIAYINPTSTTSNMAVATAGSNGANKYMGWTFVGSNILTELVSGGSLGAVTLGAYQQVASHYSFSVDHSTVVIRNFVNGALFSTSSAIATAGLMDGAGSGNGLTIGTWSPGSSFNGEIARVHRMLNVGKACSDAEIAALVLADYNYKMPLLA